MVRVNGKSDRQGARASLERLVTVGMPYGFAASGLLLGAGGVLVDRPLAGACGAVAGVTAGLLERHRANDAERRTRWLRDRLRVQRAEAELEASGLRRQIQSLQTQLWERDLRDLGVSAKPVPVADEPEAVGPIARVIDLSEARGQAEPPAGEREPARGKDRAAG
jgi:hypothetical protein